jgi:hypothetical protein
MEYDQDKVDNVILALMYLTLHDGNRAWKGFDWDSTDRLYQKGMIENPQNKNKSIVLTEAGLGRSAELFRQLFQTGETKKT